jgi:hypothetical protein
MSSKLLTLLVAGTGSFFLSWMDSTTKRAVLLVTNRYKPGLPLMARMFFKSIQLHFKSGAKVHECFSTPVQ